MLLQRLHQYRLRHFQPLIQIHKLFILSLAILFGRDSAKGAVEVVYAVDKVVGEA